MRTATAIISTILTVVATRFTVASVRHATPNVHKIYVAWFVSTILATLSIWILTIATLTPLGDEILYDVFIKAFPAYLFLDCWALTTPWWSPTLHKKAGTARVFVFLGANILFWIISRSDMSPRTRVLRAATTILIVHDTFFNLFIRAHAVQSS